MKNKTARLDNKRTYKYQMHAKKKLISKLNSIRKIPQPIYRKGKNTECEKKNVVNNDVQRIEYRYHELFTLHIKIYSCMVLVFSFFFFFFVHTNTHDFTFNAFAINSRVHDFIEVKNHLIIFVHLLRKRNQKRDMPHFNRILLYNK